MYDVKLFIAALLRLSKVSWVVLDLYKCPRSGQLSLY